MLTTKEGFALLDITSRQTIYVTLKHFSWDGKENLTWNHFRLLLELQTFRGLKPGRNSIEEFLQLTRTELNEMFREYSIDIEDKLKKLKQKHGKNLINNAKANNIAVK